jgi:hypothetical protein
MALTEKIRNALQGKGFDTLYSDHEDDWTELANGARELIKPHIRGGEPTVDDIKAVLQPIVEVHDHYTSFLDDHPKLTQKYWLSYFTDYLLHQVYQPRLNVNDDEENDEDD